MGQTTFQQILEEKMAEPVTRPSFQRETGGAEPAHLAFLLGQVGVFRFPAQRRPTMTTHSAKPTPPPRPTPTRPKGPAHSLDERQKTAMVWFANRGERLEEDFTSTELRSAFRRLARRLHPDISGGDTQPFLELKAAQSALKDVVAKATTTAA